VRLDGPGFLTRLVPPGFGARRWIVLALIGIVQMAGLMGFLFLGLRTISPSTAAILIFTNPISVALLSRLILDERLTAPRDRRSRLRRSRCGLRARLQSSR
jgi:drug/metabolite transporter (DMT)-like permease